MLELNQLKPSAKVTTATFKGLNRGEVKIKFIPKSIPYESNNVDVDDELSFTSLLSRMDLGIDDPNHLDRADALKMVINNFVKPTEIEQRKEAKSQYDYVNVDESPEAVEAIIDELSKLDSRLIFGLWEAWQIAFTNQSK